jgi:hypothetical protein
MPMETRRRGRRYFAPDPEAPGRSCDMAGCPLPGEYRAPKSRHNLRDYWWFCLEHVRAYNRAWDYYRGMSAAEIEREIRADLSWQRPTWPLGGAGFGVRLDDIEAVRADPLGALGGRERTEPAARLPPALREALRELDLGWPVSAEEAKRRYKTLAKRHHPDVAGGDAAAAERFKRINGAYSTLRQFLALRPGGSEPR